MTHDIGLRCLHSEPFISYIINTIKSPKGHKNSIKHVHHIKTTPKMLIESSNNVKMQRSNNDMKLQNFTKTGSQTSIPLKNHKNLYMTQNNLKLASK